MTPDLRYLAFTALLTAALWIPYIVAQLVTNGPLAPPNYLDPTARPVPPWGSSRNHPTSEADRACVQLTRMAEFDQVFCAVFTAKTAQW